MFLPSKNDAQPSHLPRGSAFTAADWDVLAGFWHPVALSSDVADAPVAAILLDEQLVLWRSADGVQAAKDVCMHRGGKLTLGSVRDGMLVCPLHGFHYGSDGMCQKIPALADGVPIPPKMRLKSYNCTERYGWVWVCLAQEPIAPMPEWPELEAEGTRVVIVPPGIWESSAARHVENFNDLCHIPFVHRSTFGGEENRTVEAYDVDIDDHCLAFETEYVEQQRYADRGEGGALLPLNRRQYKYRLTLPFGSSLRIFDKAQGTEFHIYDAASPVSVDVCNIFQLLVDKSGRLTEAEMIAFQQRINAEDAPLVEAQSPYELPLDLRDEIHIPADRMSIEYRRALAKLGLGAEAIHGGA